MAKIADIEGIGEAYSAKLSAAGVVTLDDLLTKGAGRAGRKDLAEKTGLSETLILKWVNRADLDRVKGVGAEFADLLELAGVDSVPELAQRKAANLTLKLKEINDAKHLVRRLPSETEVDRWIQDASGLAKVVLH